MSKVYHINITNVKDGVAIADGHGGLDVIAYIARDARRQMDAAENGTDFSVTVVEKSAILGETLRSVAAVTGDAEVASYVLLKRLRAEKATSTPAPEAPEGTVTVTPLDAEAETTEVTDETPAPEGRRSRRSNA